MGNLSSSLLTPTLLILTVWMFILLVIVGCWYCRNIKLGVYPKLLNLFGRYQVQKFKGSIYELGRGLSLDPTHTRNDRHNFVNLFWNDQFMDISSKQTHISNPNNDKYSIEKTIVQFKAIVNKVSVDEQEDVLVKRMEYEKNLNKPVEKSYAKYVNHSMV